MRHRHQMTAPVASNFTLNSTLLESRIWIAEAFFVAVMLLEGNDAIHFLAPHTAQNKLDRRLQIVIAQATKYATELLKRLPVCFEKGTLG